TGIKRKEAEPRDVPGLLGLRRKRPRDCRTANERDELASSHGLPSSGQERYATTFLSENAVVHHSKISQPMSQLGRARHPLTLRDLKQIKQCLTADALQPVIEVDLAAHAFQRETPWIAGLCRGSFSRFYSAPE